MHTLTGKRPARILMLTVRADHGGGPEHLYQLVSQLKGRIEVFIAAPRDKPYWSRFESMVGSLRMIELPHRRFSFFYLLRLLRFIRKNRIELLHSHGKGAGIYSRLLSCLSGRRCVHTFHGIHTDAYSRPMRSLYICIERFLSLFTNSFIVTSDGERDKAFELGLVSEKKTVLIHNGVLLPKKTVSFEVFHTDYLNVLTVSRFDYAKNSQLVIPVLQNIFNKGYASRLRLHFVGDGEDRQAIENELKKRNLHQLVYFHGFVDDVTSFYLDSFCFLSTSRWEGLPLSVLEAMAFGIPVIATDVIGNRDLVEHEKTGYLYSSAHPEKAAEYLMQLMDNQQTWRNFSISSREKVVREFTVVNMAEKTFQQYMKYFLAKSNKIHDNA